MEAFYQSYIILQDVTPQRILVATRYNPAIKTFYQRLCGVGKAKKVALVSSMRKLLTMLKHRARWRTEPPQHA